MEEVVVNGQVENVVQDCPESGVVAETRRTRTNMAADDETMAMELEEEFQRLCGREDQAESLQVCMRVGKAIRNVEVLVMAEVAKYMRCGHPGREGIEQVGREATEAAIEELALLRMKCKESTVIGKWVQVVLESLECDSRAEGVEQLAELLEIREEETLRAQLEELSELRELKSRFAAQERELQQMRRKLDSEAPEASERYQYRSPATDDNGTGGKQQTKEGRDQHR
ncbi:unnamed protein product [Nippostrongylus brasiliensis]|uniref:Mediator of RNA polymerase II transcription subunit 21 n=1 Tax=Nippostrongylus brasiliensis TaxID=27835 RepID=A0A0N4XRL2_NIPBR|nr:unnamed protein product [Nippostrongylus brasiliensis]